METTTETILDVTTLAPAVKHSTIFAHVDALKDGDSFIIHNDHDPKPLYFQLHNLYGDSYTWEYLEQGPRWWKVRIGKEAAGMANSNVLDVTKLAPAVKHSTIFGRIAQLGEGQSLVIHNDHDPAPLRHQLGHTHPGTIQWEYLEKGPEWWKVKITKISPRNAEAGLNILDVTKLPPAIKHSTIFERIAKLQGGESLTIHNDHDPKPLRYHLEAEHGDAYGWEYLEEGPEWWKVKITRRIAGSASQAGENILDVTKLAPREKHPTIFSRYHALKKGESLTIHNDHDPKPLYYQMQGEMGDVFTWEYLEQGPKWWRVKITKRPDGAGAETLGEIVTKDMRKAEVFKKYGLDFCCNGGMTVAEACAAKGLDVTRIEQELREADKVQTSTALPYNDWNIDFLADFIVNTHHGYLRKNLPEIGKYSAKVAQVHGMNHPELNQVNKLVQEVIAEFTAHLPEEEKTMFPYIKQLVAAKNAGQPLPASTMGRFKDSLDTLVKEHVSVGGKLDEINEITDGYTLPGDACASYTLLFRLLHELEDDTHVHIHLENNILFPKAAELERSFH
ncbi:MAG TPA: iron-sulfur cluster repair di-iron protein [Flavobacteriales bacterium]|nr:iron-sulfur cluster repair di-iron protein [Flavobacteriales bacterium]HRP82215.1 iron-sulfur cluster repair di-iron protein [Flavobacteriales bacterium]HRQ85081.1 iron-sulfur cluster repair di-iron protein [Flavobacteriales bacterium]